MSARTNKLKNMKGNVISKLCKPVSVSISSGLSIHQNVFAADKLASARSE